VAPARWTLRAGAILLVAVTGCDRPGAAPGPRVLELAHDTIDLPVDVTLHEVAVRRTQAGEFEPAAVAATVGDVLRFTARDNAGHAVQFDGAALAPAARDYLERTGQLRGPPLIETGAAWIITFADAPAGEYPFHCAMHPGQTGRVSVSER
jgi:plastocyanin